MIRLATYSLDRILPFIGCQDRFNLDGDFVNVTSLRLRCFKMKGLTCVRCGLVGEFFAKEKSAVYDKTCHLNLYAIGNGTEVLMTRDHIVPRCEGGKDNMSNSQTMCMPCNSKKGCGKNRAVKNYMTGIERIDTILGNLFNIVEQTGKLHISDLTQLSNHVRSSMVDSIVPKALKSVAVGCQPSDFDGYNQQVFKIAPNVTIAHGIEDVTQDCHKFYILNVRTGERLNITLNSPKQSTQEVS
jgi:hypothetical protein